MKKKIIFLIIIILLLIAGGFFWWRQGREIKGSPADYIIKETEEGKIVENKKAGLTVKVPEGWKVEKIEVEEGEMAFYSPDAEVELREGKVVLPLKKGCAIHTNIVYKEMNFDQIKEEAKYTHFMLGSRSEEFEEMTINNYRVLKNIFDTRDTDPGIGIYIPRKNKVYSFYLFWASNEKESCNQEFDKFLETVSIE